MNKENKNPEIIAEIASVYVWLDAQAAALGRFCRACGNCCDFEAYGHRLYVTPPELLYFAHFAGPDIRPMPSGVCPYRVDGKCSAYPHRFAACRIFDCGTGSPAQSRLSESVLRRFKDMCAARSIPYRYLYLKDALDLLAQGGLPQP